MAKTAAEFTEAECRRAIRVAKKHDIPRVEMKDSKGRTLVFILSGVDNPKDDSVASWNEAIAELEAQQ